MINETLNLDEENKKVQQMTVAEMFRDREIVAARAERVRRLLYTNHAFIAPQSEDKKTEEK